MVDLNLDFDEGIILETEGVHCSKNGKKTLIKKMILTNKNIIYVTSQKTGGMFSKSVNVAKKVPLSEIKVINGQVLVSQLKTDLFEYGLQIQFMSGVEKYSYNEGSKKITNQWINELNRLLGDEQSIQTQDSIRKEEMFGGLSDIASSVGTMAGTLGQSMSSAAKQAADQVNAAYENTKEQFGAKHQEQEKAEIQKSYDTKPSQSRMAGRFCANCGTKLAPGIKFCSECGTAVGDSVSSMVPPISTAQPSNFETRQQEFAGKVLKCPNCGAVISQTTAVCPECGHHITGQAAVSSVQLFSDKLMMLESKRKGAGLGQILGVTANPVDTQKLSLIRSFPIPNTIDDIQEFMMLAIANIDVSLSKNTFGNRLSKVKAVEDDSTVSRKISNAWVAKMQQAYQKAEASFPNEPAFEYVKQLYVDKMTELKMKIE